ncbi:unnamed protein product [Rotaria sp. Silwood2]|nr:unnamed protein product [Rotaria sp. Silwood2]CAF4144556.1 unnamed protein product [Rotaria sp. Silwood2]
MFNILYISRHAVSTEHNAFITTSLSLAANSQTNTSDNQSETKYNLFDETYQIFLQSFTANFMFILARQNKSSSHCPSIPPNLKGPIIMQDPPENFSLLNKSPYHLEVQHGDRWDILRHFLFHTHEFLQRQQLDYRIYVCEQAFDKTFNKGIVMNSCFKEILNLEPNTPCFIMHDVDLLLIDDRNMYTCPSYPRHLSVAIDKFDFYLPYPELVGGVLAMRREHYTLVNGYSTNYWGWGGEDDDMYKRITKKNLILERPPASIARYRMLKHTHQKLNPARMKVLRTAHIRIDSDGVNNVKYKLLNTTFHHLYTHFLIDVGEQRR